VIASNPSFNGSDVKARHPNQQPKTLIFGGWPQ
jgi:hypothetical protein